VCGNATSQPNANSMSESAIVSMTSGVFANNPPREINLLNFHDNSKQIVLHFLRYLGEYYRIKNVPESLKLPLAMRAVTDPIAKSWFSTVNSKLNGYEYFKTLFKIFFMEFAHPIHGHMLNYQDKFTRQGSESLTSHYLR